MNKFTIRVAFVGSLLMSGCASQSGWTPTVDTYGDKNAARLSQDMEDCQALATRVAGSTGKETAIGAATGGAIGAATGAVAGSIFGDAGIGAALGALFGGVGGAGQQGFDAERRYKNAYNNCLAGRGHRVLR